ncbi:MAG: FtsX-like permease family protein, partial [Sphingomonadales bacterium]
EFLLPYVNEYLGKTMGISLLAKPDLLGLIAGVLVFIGLVGGLFPAWFVSGSKPASILSGGNVLKMSKGGLRGFLVVFQFAISVGLIIMTFVVHSQTKFAHSLDTGFETGDRIVLFGTQRGPEETKRIVETLKNELLAYPGIISVAGSSNVPGLEDFSRMQGFLLGLDSNDQITLSMMSVGNDFFETYGIQTLAGRDFDPAFPADQLTGQISGPEIRRGTAIINVTAANRLGLGLNEAVGQSIRLNFGTEDAAPYEVRVIGVVPDLHLRSARDSIEPQIFVNNPQNFDYLSFQVRAGSLDTILPEIEAAWDRVMPDQAISWSYVDDILGRQYLAEDRQGLTLTVAAILATVIASMGLYGMAAFAVEQKTKEIGVRKVFGATIPDILRLIIFQFSKPVLVANLIAWPVAWYFLSDWLGAFVYRIDLNPMFFVGASFMALLVAWVAVGGHAIRVAGTNPVNVLKSE